jgi:hypothetical protein
MKVLQISPIVERIRVPLWAVSREKAVIRKNRDEFMNYTVRVIGRFYFIFLSDCLFQIGILLLDQPRAVQSYHQNRKGHHNHLFV